MMLQIKELELFYIKMDTQFPLWVKHKGLRTKDFPLMKRKVWSYCYQLITRGHTYSQQNLLSKLLRRALSILKIKDFIPICSKRLWQSWWAYNTKLYTNKGQPIKLLMPCPEYHPHPQLKFCHFQWLRLLGCKIYKPATILMKRLKSCCQNCPWEGALKGFHW